MQQDERSDRFICQQIYDKYKYNKKEEILNRRSAQLSRSIEGTRSRPSASRGWLGAAMPALVASSIPGLGGNDGG
jgi:hypothetical protein